MRKLTFYLKFLMGMLLFAFIAPPAAHAETLTVANGTSTSNCVPVHSSYMDAAGSKYQVIYPAELLSAMKNSLIPQHFDLTLFISS